MYEIIITKTKVQEVESGGDWTVIGEELAIPEAIPLSADDLDGLKLKKIYGYTPKVIGSKAVTTEIFRQTVPDLDLPAVIKAVNRL